MSQLWNNKLCLRGDSSKLASSISDASLKSADLTSELIGCFACAHPSAGSCRWLGEFICRATSRVKRGIGRWHFVNPVDCTSVPQTCGPRYIIIVDCFVSSAPAWISFSLSAVREDVRRCCWCLSFSHGLLIPLIETSTNYWTQPWNYI